MSSVGWSQKDSSNLERIATALESISQVLSALPNINEHPLAPPPLPQQTDSPEAQLFQAVTQVYIDEELMKRERGLQRKSGVRVSKNLTNVLVDFFQKLLPDFEVGYFGPFIIFKKDEKNEAVLRFFTDLGFSRGKEWYKDVENIVNSISIAVKPERVFIMVASIVNSLDNSHVEEILNRECPENMILLTPTYRDLLKEYLQRYVDHLSSLPNPSEQVFFLGADVHPNVAASDYLDKGEALPLNAEWLRPSVTEFVTRIESLI